MSEAVCEKCNHKNVCAIKVEASHAMKQANEMSAAYKSVKISVQCEHFSQMITLSNRA